MSVLTFWGMLTLSVMVLVKARRVEWKWARSGRAAGSKPLGRKESFIIFP